MSKSSSTLKVNDSKDFPFFISGGTVRTLEIETTFSKTVCLGSYKKAINLETGWQVPYNMIKKPRVTLIFLFHKNLKEIILISVFLLLIFLFHYTRKNRRPMPGNREFEIRN